MPPTLPPAPSRAYETAPPRRASPLAPRRFAAIALPGVALVALRAEVIDVSFDPSPNASVMALAVQPDGKLLVGGAYSRIAAVSRSHFARLNVDGSLDAAFEPAVVGSVMSIAVQPDGKILVGGALTSVAGQPTGRLVRFEVNGARDTTFAANVVGTMVRAILVQPDGKILVGGNFTSINSTPRTGLARLNSNGSVDTGFGADASGSSGNASPGVFALARQSDGSIVLGGQFTTVAGQTRWGLARVRSDGSLDAGFNPLTSVSSVSSIAVQRDDKILLGGGSFHLGSQIRSWLARLNSNGTLDAPFAPVINYPVQSVIEQPDGKILIGGLFTALADGPHSFLGRLNTDGSPDEAFRTEASGTLGTSQPGVNDLVVAPGGRIYVGGVFSIVGGQPRNALARLVAPAPQIVLPPQNSTIVAGNAVTFTVTVVGDPPTYQWRKNGGAIAGATGSTFTLAAVQSGDAGSYDVVVSNSLGTATSVAAVLIVNGPPVVTEPPRAIAVIVGAAASLAVTAVGTPAPAYQWLKNGATIPGATAATLTIAAAQFADGGIYSCVVTNSIGTVTSTPATLMVLAPTRLSNVSVRTTLANTQSLIVGFVVRGGSTNVLVRAAGPALAPFGVTPVLADPRLELYQDSTKLLENNDWPGILAPTMNSVGAFPFEANSKDAALLQNANGSYSAVVSGTAAGVVLVEVYDTNSEGAARLVNLSVRARVGVGSDPLFAGFNVAGQGVKRVLIRAVGPTIGGVPFNVPDTIADPKLELYDSAGRKIAENDNWDPELAPVFASAGAFALAPGSKDAAIVVTLSGGGYTAQISGAANAAGVALVEAYELP